MFSPKTLRSRWSFHNRPSTGTQGHVEGTWHITASGHDEIYSGELQVEVGPLVDLTKLMRSLLELDSH